MLKKKLFVLGKKSKGEDETLLGSVKLLHSQPIIFFLNSKTDAQYHQKSYKLSN